MGTIYCDTSKLPERRLFEYYPTGLLTVRQILGCYQHTKSVDSHCQHPRRILDPGAGCGSFGKVARELWPQAEITGCELRDIPVPVAYDRWHTGDFVKLYVKPVPVYDLIIGNPPFREAEPFVRTALPLLVPGGHLIFLLRLAFLEGQRRRDGLFTEFPPKEVWVLSKRPSFMASGKTNATAFCALLWQHGWEGRTSLSWLR